jgi:RNA polymerase sigma factor (sigma-70 family)
VAEQSKIKTNLIEALTSREPEKQNRAFEAVVNQFHYGLIAFAERQCSRKLRVRYAPEDVVMDVWADFYYSLTQGQVTFDDDEALTPFLQRMTLRKIWKVAERHCAERRNVNREQEIGDLDAIASAHPSFEESLAFRSTLQELYLQLEPDLSEILERRLQGYGTNEIADALGVSRWTIQLKRKRLARIVAEALQLDKRSDQVQ